jgi:hypothetical protein
MGSIIFAACLLQASGGDRRPGEESWGAEERTHMHRIVVPIRALALVLGLVAPITVRAEVVSVPSADPPSSAASLPAPTVLRGSPPSTARPDPTCPPGYAFSSDYGCVAASSGDYTEGSPGYDYSPDWGDDFPFGGSPGFGSGAGRFHRFSGLHNFHRFAGVHNGRAFHGRAGFHGAAGFHSFGMGVGHAGGFGRR